MLQPQSLSSLTLETNVFNIWKGKKTITRLDLNFNTDFRMKLIAKHEKEKLLHSGKGIDKPQNLTAEALFNGRTERTLSDFEWNKNAHDCHIFTQPIMNFLASVLRPRKKKKPREEPKLIYTKIQKIYRLRIVRLKREKSIAFLYINKSKLKRNENLKYHL